MSLQWWKRRLCQATAQRRVLTIWWRFFKRAGNYADSTWNTSNNVLTNLIEPPTFNYLLPLLLQIKITRWMFRMYTKNTPVIWTMAPVLPVKLVIVGQHFFMQNVPYQYYQTELGPLYKIIWTFNKLKKTQGFSLYRW